MRTNEEKRLCFVNSYENFSAGLTNTELFFILVFAAVSKFIITLLNAICRNYATKSRFSKTSTADSFTNNTLAYIVTFLRTTGLHNYA